jgi:hypothetical protein
LLTAPLRTVGIVILVPFKFPNLISSYPKGSKKSEMNEKFEPVTKNKTLKKLKKLQKEIQLIAIMVE